MAKKDLKGAASNTSVYDAIVKGTQYVQDVHNAQDVHNVQDVEKKTKPRVKDKHGEPISRLNLMIPTEIKDYLQEAAYRESSPKKTVSLTEYLCDLVRADMEKHR